VIGAVGNESKCAEVLARGASHCIVYTKDSLRDKVKEITRGKGADIVFDAVGGKVFDDCVRWWV
jgi:NADPH2:quinone reductase